MTDTLTIEVEINDPADEVTFEQLRIVIAAVIADRADFRRIVRAADWKPLSGTEADVGDINFPPDQD